MLSSQIYVLIELELDLPCILKNRTSDKRHSRFIPTFTSRLLIVSSDGDFILVEPSDVLPPTTPYYKINTMGGSITDVSLSTSVQVGLGENSSIHHHLTFIIQNRFLTNVP